MKVALLQTDIAWADPAANLAYLDGAFANYPGMDLYVLPEMFTTGFATVPEGIAEEAPSSSLEWMKRKARELDAAIAGSIALHVDGSYRNRFYFVKPDGDVVYYDKHHLFTYGGEHKLFTAGDEQVVVSWRGWRFRLVVCYDLRFPLWCRNRDEYDVLICVANWPSVRQLALDTLFRARAIENQCYLLGVNRVGKDPACVYAGGTAVIHPYGDTLAGVASGQVGVAVAELDKSMLESYRNRFPVLQDADPFKFQ